MNIGRKRFGYWFSCFVAITLAKILFGLRTSGIEKFPLEGTLLIVSNHVSNLDPPIVGAVVPREVHFAAKIQLFKGLLGKWVSYHNAFPVKRSGSDTEAIKSMVRVLKEGKALLMFPEGTRTLDPNGQAAKGGVGMAAALAKPLIVPMRIDGSHEPLKALFRPGGVTVRVGDPIPFEQVLEETRLKMSGSDGEISKKELYQALAERMMDYVKALRVS